LLVLVTFVDDVVEDDILDFLEKFNLVLQADHIGSFLFKSFEPLLELFLENISKFRIHRLTYTRFLNSVKKLISVVEIPFQILIMRRQKTQPLHSSLFLKLHLQLIINMLPQNVNIKHLALIVYPSCVKETNYLRYLLCVMLVDERLAVKIGTH
jgi:hypothetical protein